MRLYKKENTRINHWHCCLLLVVSLCLWSSCGADVQNKLKPKPSAFGKINEINVIADKALWEGAVGDTFRYYFTSAYPILPQPESYFSVRHFTAEDLIKDPIRKEFQTYIILGNLKDTDSGASKLIARDLKVDALSPTATAGHTKIGKNKWALDQIIFYMYADKDDTLIKTITKNFTAVAKRIKEMDSNALESTIFQQGDNNKLRREIKEKMGVDLRLPSDYFEALYKDSTMWLRRETDVLSANIFIHKLKYTNKSQLSKNGIKAIRDRLGKYVSTDIENTYMRTNDVDLPMLTQVVTIDNRYAVEAKGIWDIVNDYMGGPFISYLIHDKDTNELILLDGFIHAPSKKKRDYMQQMEYLLSNVKL